ncbi:MAG: biotin--[acetyl-CoA-carboxylase] ligase [Bacteroidota bacterium]
MFHSIGKKIVLLDEVDSTNNFAAKLLLEGKLVPGTVIMADHQTEGRGQRTAVWVSDAGENMLFSVIFEHDNMAVANQFQLSQMIALSIVHFLRKIGIPAKIKWPNDVLVNKKKIAGVLIENQLAGGLVRSSVVGIGINANQLQFEITTATSIRKELDEFKPIQELLYQFIGSFNELTEKIHSQEELQSNYLQELFGYKEILQYEDDQGEFAGEIIDVAADGRLIVLKNGVAVKYDLKEISLLLV